NHYGTWHNQGWIDGECNVEGSPIRNKSPVLCTQPASPVGFTHTEDKTFVCTKDGCNKIFTRNQIYRHIKEYILERDLSHVVLMVTRKSLLSVLIGEEIKEFIQERDRTFVGKMAGIKRF